MQSIIDAILLWSMNGMWWGFLLVRSGWKSIDNKVKKALKEAFLLMEYSVYRVVTDVYQTHILHFQIKTNHTQVIFTDLWMSQTLFHPTHITVVLSYDGSLWRNLSFSHWHRQPQRDIEDTSLKTEKQVVTVQAQRGRLSLHQVCVQTSLPTSAPLDFSVLSWTSVCFPP